MENIHELEGYDDFVERLLSTLTPEERREVSFLTFLFYARSGDGGA